MEQGLCRRIDTQDRPLLVHHNQAFLHAPCDLFKLICPGLQLLHLGIDLPALLLDAPQQGGQLLVGVIFQRVVQIQGVEGLDNSFCHPTGQNSG